MIVPIIFESEEYIKEKPAYLWVFYKFARFSLDGDSPIIATEEYFKKPSYYRECKHSATIVMDYYGINDNFFDDLKKYVITDEEKKKILEQYSNNVDAWVHLLKERDKELEKVLEKAINYLESKYEKIDAFMVWTYLPSIDYIAKKHNITLINQEASAIRTPFYNRLLNYFQFQNKYDTSNLKEQYSLFCESEKVLCLSRKELFALLVDKQNIHYLNDIDTPPLYEVGYGMGVATDCFANVYSKWTQSDILEAISHLASPDKICIRPHPKEPVDLSTLGFIKDESPTSFDWILKCRRIVADLSNVSFEAAFLGKTIISLSSCMPSSFGEESSLDYLEEEVMSVKKLNFLLFAWFTPEELTQDVEYVSWRLTNPHPIEIYNRNLEYILKSLDMSYQELLSLDVKDRLDYILEKRHIDKSNLFSNKDNKINKNYDNTIEGILKKMKDINSYKMTSYDYRKLIVELNKKINELDNSNELLKNENKCLLESKTFYQDELNKVLNSSSWKLTSPLRKLKSIGKKEIVEPNSDVQEKEEPKVITHSYKEYEPYTSTYQDNIDFSKYDTDIKTLAFYLPQYHTFKENDLWWGKGFTEWVNTKKSKPKFAGHYQPRTPHKDFGYYTLDNVDTIKKQVELAKQHKIYGFIFYYYWFSGKRLMEKPVDLFLKDKSIDFPFCFCWANENWTRTWDGLEDDVLIKQDYKKDDYRKFIKDIKKYLLDNRYIKIDGKPVIMIYNPSAIPNFKELVTKWREYAIEEGIGELYIMDKCELADTNYKYTEYTDASFDFPPHGVGHPATKLTGLSSPKIFNYKKIVDDIEHLYKEHFPLKPFYYSITMGWDNSARRTDGYTIYYNYSLESYYKWLKIIIRETRRRNDEEHRFIFVNAWNEWAEGTYLEPDEKYGYANINTLSKAICDLPLDKKDEKKNKM